MKYVYCFMMFLYCNQLKGQILFEEGGLFKENTSFYEIGSLFLIDEKEIKDSTVVLGKSFYGKNNVKHAFIPTSYEGILLASEGIKKVEGMLFYGKIKFKEQYNNATLGKNTFESFYQSPYYLTDTIQKQWKLQQVKAETLVSNGTDKKLHTTLKFTYHVQHKVNNQFPKALLYKNSLAVSPSFGYKFNKKHRLVFKYNYQNNTKEITIDGGTIAQSRIFSITGVGNLANNKGLGSNYRFEKEISNEIGLQGAFKLARNTLLKYQFSLEQVKQRGFDDALKQVQVFDYDEWITKGAIYFKKESFLNIFYMSYGIFYQDGKGRHMKPRINNTFTEKLFQKIKVSLYQKEQATLFTASINHTHKQEVNTIYANLYDIDYIEMVGSYKKQFFIKRGCLSFLVGVGYQTSTFVKNRFVKENVYIKRYLLPYLQFYNQDFYYINFLPKFKFPIKSMKSSITIGIHTNLTMVNHVNFYNALFLKANF
ncbi:DUF6850 family outer membrane beta-barrel protein [Tenacibaculum maritimum]|uniref:DUF6850 family outer membrane beta-barrel protein n=1 Tax=Tenacibaculum maritimum TaxID=107401 RepID=UPI003877513D